MLELAKQTGLDLNHAKQIIEQVKEVLKPWKTQNGHFLGRSEL